MGSFIFGLEPCPALPDHLGLFCSCFSPSYYYYTSTFTCWAHSFLRTWNPPRPSTTFFGALFTTPTIPGRPAFCSTCVEDFGSGYTRGCCRSGLFRPEPGPGPRPGPGPGPGPGSWTLDFAALLLNERQPAGLRCKTTNPPPPPTIVVAGVERTHVLRLLSTSTEKTAKRAAVFMLQYPPVEPLPTFNLRLSTPPPHQRHNTRSTAHIPEPAIEPSITKLWLLTKPTIPSFTPPKSRNSLGTCRDWSLSTQPRLPRSSLHGG